MSSLLCIMHGPCFHYSIVISYYYHYYPLLHITNETCRWKVLTCIQRACMIFLQCVLWLGPAGAAAGLCVRTYCYAVYTKI